MKNLSFFAYSAVLAALVLGISGCDQGSVSAEGAISPVSARAPAKPNPSPTPTSTPTPLPSPAPTPIGSYVQQVLTLTNQFRAANGVAALTLNAQLTNAAQNFAALMLQLDFFAHDAPDGTTPGQRIEAAGYTNWTTWGENIAEGYSTPEDVVNGWINSPGHRANMLDAAFKDIGIGYVAGPPSYWVQDFGSR